MKILFTASEMVPFCKTGGLADVIGTLPPVLAGMGHEVSVMLPGYASINHDRYAFEEKNSRIEVPVGAERVPLTVSSARWNGVQVYLLENRDYYGRRGLYGDADGDYPDNGRRFILFSRGVLETAKELDLTPDIIHAHDWQAGLVVAYTATVYADNPRFSNTATLFTIHNLGYQGIFPYEVFLETGISEKEFLWTKMEYWGLVSFLKSGIVYADAVSTVSETYADEITREPLGFGLHGVLAGRRNTLHGIVNGLDTDAWDPSRDQSIPAAYGSDDMKGKKICRKALLAACGFRAKRDVPVFGMVARLDRQKGFDLLEETMGRLMSMDIMMIILGTGIEEHQKRMKNLAGRYPDRLHVALGFDNDMAHLIYAGADAFLMPSRFEPCGLGQLIAMRYGTLPVVHATGGLADTVRDLDSKPDGNGFPFHLYHPRELVKTMGRAVEVFRTPGKKLWKRAVATAMAEDVSWERSAEKYVDLYREMLNNRTLYP